MLPAEHRMRRAADFSRAFSGSRGSSRRLQIAVARDESFTDPHPVRVGFAVSKRVGNSVVRHRVYRQLRHLMRARLDLFEAGELVVVRAFPPAKGSASRELAADLDNAIGRVRAKEKGRKDYQVDDVEERNGG